MTNDELYIIKLNIAHFQTMLKLDIDDEKRSAVERLLAEAEEVLAADSKENRRPDITTKEGTARVSPASKLETETASVTRAPRSAECLAMEEIGTQGPSKLRELASWYREFADRAGNPAIWDARLRTAADLDAEAERSERRLAADSRVTGRLPS
jgi:hypothetical protein